MKRPLARLLQFAIVLVGVAALALLLAAASHGAFPPTLASSLRIIRYCALVIVAFVAVGEAFIMSSDSDDRAGGVFMGLLSTVAALAVAAASLLLQRKWERGQGLSPPG